MRWRRGRRSSNIEDRRGQRVGGGLMKGGVGTIVLALALGYFLGIDPSVLLQLQQGLRSSQTSEVDYRPTPEEAELADFVSVVLADTEDTWREIFREAGLVYEEPKLVLFSGSVRSACGMASAAMGPFYCPADRKVYIDLSFFADLRRRHGAPGDFAQAYVIAHEVGHHVQTLLDTGQRVGDTRQRIASCLDDHLDGRTQRLRIIVADPGRALRNRTGNIRRPNLIGRPPGSRQRLRGSFGRQIADGADMHARRTKRLMQIHGREFARADQRNTNGTALVVPLLQGLKHHASLLLSASSSISSPRCAI